MPMNINTKCKKYNGTIRLTQLKPLEHRQFDLNKPLVLLLPLAVVANSNGSHWHYCHIVHNDNSNCTMCTGVLTLEQGLDRAKYNTQRQLAHDASVTKNYSGCSYYTEGTGTCWQGYQTLL